MGVEQYNIMKMTVNEMAKQLELWRLQIGKLAAKSQRGNVQPRFDDLMYIDELKALHAIAQSKFDKLRAEEGAKRPRLKAEMKSAWDELEAAFKTLKS